ncbi:hypothetical protein [Streptomyces sp. NPDC051776]|uniref:hypothetical protein n=1 Tax=Streptomyces sp. NPDC051776 TaxID=3155414 RepID=UPI00342E6BCC
MGRHEFEPGKLVAGLALLAAGLVYALDAAGAWSVPAWALIPVVVGGLSLAGATGAVRSALRRGAERSGRWDRGGTEEHGGGAAE